VPGKKRNRSTTSGDQVFDTAIRTGFSLSTSATTCPAVAARTRRHETFGVLVGLHFIGYLTSNGLE
jgi:hypothetical protein